jgi:hypothetical protein
MTCTRCGGPLQPDWTCPRCQGDVWAAPMAPSRARPHRFRIMVTAGCALAVLTLSGNEVCMIVHPNGNRDVTSFYDTTTGLKPTRTPAV